LTLEQVNPKSIHIHAKTNQHVNHESFVTISSQDNELKTLITYFYKCDPCDLDLRPSDPKLYMVLVITKTNPHVKNESSVLIVKENEQ